MILYIILIIWFVGFVFTAFNIVITNQNDPLRNLFIAFFIAFIWPILLVLIVNEVTKKVFCNVL